MTRTNQKIKLGIVDDDLLVVQLLTDFFNQTDDIEVNLTATSGNSFLEKLRTGSERPDVVLLDLRMNDGNGLVTLDELQKRSEKIKIIVLTSFYNSSFIGQMLKLGVAAFLPKDIERSELIDVIQTVFNKGFYFSSAQMDIVRSQLSPKAPKIHLPGKNALSEREIDVLKLLCQQYTTQGIADKLFISAKTVESHKSNLLVKTGVKNMAGLVIYAIQNGIVDADELILLDR
ncbi:MAG: response regulator transcription factor [Crocinitomicaceae bacterium]|nr:response regulator transcription factor [Flavobacteriales bacterium]NQZ36910.1 response regulator transcription factor [Crocinitomicaceae bacterium]